MKQNERQVSSLARWAEARRIGAYIDKHNEKAKPFIWKAKAADILEKVKRARTA